MMDIFAVVVVVCTEDRRWLERFEQEGGCEAAEKILVTMACSFLDRASRTMLNLTERAA